MRKFSWELLFGLAIAPLLGCSEPAGLAKDVRFDVVPASTQSAPSIVSYRFVVKNEGDAVIWMPTCAQRVTPDIAIVVDGRTVDTLNGDTCFGLGDSSPLALAPGTTYSGDRAIPAREGARYEPSLVVARDRALTASARLQSAVFSAP